MHGTAHIVVIALGLVAGLACAQENSSHCGNQNGDATCRGRGYMYCSTCSAMNDGCTDVLPRSECMPVGGGTGTTAAGTSSAASSDATSTTTGTTGMTGSTSSGPAPESSSSMGEDPTTGASTCGNAVIDAEEDCDGEDLDDQTCMSRGFPGGTLSCTADCRFDEASCDVVPGCGNDVRDGEEQCDGEDFGDSTCTTYSTQYGGGALQCNPNCTIDASGCCVASGQNCQVSLCCEGLACNGLLNLCF